MMDSFEGIQTQQLSRSGITNETRSTTPPEAGGGAPSLRQGQDQNTYSFDNVRSTPRRIGGHSRTDSVSSSESSNDGIEWEDEARYYDSDEGDEGEEHSMDEGDDEEDEDDYEYDDQEQDTQGLLAPSSNARSGGLGMGMRVGETGTGTTIGFDFEHNQGRDYDQEYDALPLTTVDRELSRHGSKKKSSSSRRKNRRDRHGIFQPGVPVMGLGSVRTEQERLIAARHVRIKMMWNVFYVFAW
jgi:hypothetical protein